MPNRLPPLPALPEGEDRLDHCVVCRESPLHGFVLMEGLIGQTVGSLTHLPGAAEVLAAGLSPLRGQSPFQTFQYRKNKTNAVAFEHEGVLYLYSLGSAAQQNKGTSDNAFIDFLCDVLEHFRPRNLYVATFSRLVRSTEFSGKLHGVVKRNVDLVHCGSTVIDPRTTGGKAIWSTLAMVADMERDSIVQRLFAGTCNKYLRGEWILGDESVPPGYRRNDRGDVEVDPSAVDAVRVLLTLMPDKSISARFNHGHRWQSWAE